MGGGLLDQELGWSQGGGRVCVCVSVLKASPLGVLWILGGLMLTLGVLGTLGARRRMQSLSGPGLALPHPWFALSHRDVGWSIQ